MFSLRKSVQIAPRLSSALRMMSSKPQDHDSAGAIRAAGGGFAKMEVAHEEEYFYKQRQEQLQKLKAKQLPEVEFREKAIKDHEEAINRHKEAITELRKK